MFIGNTVKEEQVKKLCTELDRFWLDPAPPNQSHAMNATTDAQRIEHELDAALLHLGRAQALAGPYAQRWPVMLDELRDAQLLLAVNCGTARDAVTGERQSTHATR